MSDQPAQAPPPHAVVLQMLMGAWVAQMAAAAARFGVADAMARGISSADDLAREVGADADGLYRLLRGCATAGLFAETAPRQFALTPLGDCLRSDAENSVRDFLIAEAAPGHWLPWGQLYDAVKSGTSHSSEILGIPIWEYYARNPEEGATFARGMGNLSAIASRDIAPLYDASPFRRIIDVGGSQGVLLRAMLDRAPGARGVLYDLPEVVAGAKPHDRIEIVAGDFFQEVPSGGDLYLLKSILHDWPDDRCAVILGNIRRAAAPGAKLLVVETVLPSPPQPSPAAFMDLNMLVMLGGRERPADEFNKLLQDAGFTIERVVPTGGLFHLIEAV